jgi:hypothetical protein
MTGRASRAALMKTFKLSRSKLFISAFVLSLVIATVLWVSANAKIKQRRRITNDQGKNTTDYHTPTDCAVCLNLF